MPAFSKCEDMDWQRQGVRVEGIDLCYQFGQEWGSKNEGGSLTSSAPLQPNRFQRGGQERDSFCFYNTSHSNAIIYPYHFSAQSIDFPTQFNGTTDANMHAYTVVKKNLPFCLSFDRYDQSYLPRLPDLTCHLKHRQPSVPLLWKANLKSLWFFPLVVPGSIFCSSLALMAGTDAAQLHASMPSWKEPSQALVVILHASLLSYLRTEHVSSSRTELFLCCGMKTFFLPRRFRDLRESSEKKNHGSVVAKQENMIPLRCDYVYLSKIHSHCCWYLSFLFLAPLPISHE